MMIKGRVISRLFALGAEEGPPADAHEPSSLRPPTLDARVSLYLNAPSSLRPPTLDERVSLYLNAVHGERNFSNEERTDARKLLLAAMAADIIGLDEPEIGLPEPPRVPDFLEGTGVQARSGLEPLAEELQIDGRYELSEWLATVQRAGASPRHDSLRLGCRSDDLVEGAAANMAELEKLLGNLLAAGSAPKAQAFPGPIAATPPPQPALADRGARHSERWWRLAIILVAIAGVGVSGLTAWPFIKQAWHALKGTLP